MTSKRPVETVQDRTRSRLQRGSIWESVRLSRHGRFTLLGIVAVTLVANAVFDFATGAKSVASYLDIVTLVSIALFTWRPPLAAIALVFSAVAGLSLGVGEPYALALAAVAGLVVYSCSAWITLAFCAATALITVSAELLGQDVALGASVGVLAVGTASGMLGLALRRSRAGMKRLNADVDRLTRETVDAVKTERDRIADELHDIIAHDITIVLLHTRALELIDDPVDWEPSLRAISDAADQAMTDIRRMMHIVQSSTLSTDASTIDTKPIEHHIQELAGQLRSAGAFVKVTMVELLPISSSIEATLWHIANESVTNILKHAPHSRTIHIALATTRTLATFQVWNVRDTPECESTCGAHGYGLRRMSERVQLLDGTFTAGSRDNGWLVEAILPRM